MSLLFSLDFRLIEGRLRTDRYRQFIHMPRTLSTINDATPGLGLLCRPVNRRTCAIPAEPSVCITN